MVAIAPAQTGQLGWLGQTSVFARALRARAIPLDTASPAIDPTLAEARTALRGSGDVLREAFATLNRRLQSLTPGGAIETPGRPALVRGLVSDLGTFSTLWATREVNEQTSTVRTSNQAIGLDVTSPQASSSITSTAEANTMPTSYGVVQATFEKGGTPQGSRGNLSGVYAGTGAAANATSLKLEITSPDTTINNLVASLVSVKVTDQNGTDLGTYTGLLTAGQTLSLGADIGLSIAFTEGSMLKDATTTFAVSRTTPTDVDPNATFDNADVNLRPRFEGGQQVTAGSFTVNGTTVNVLASDSINTVIARIASTVPGITASFSGDKLTIQSVNPSEDSITLANDTSGFLTALNLAGAITVTGNVRDDAQVLTKTSQFASVTNGSFAVNGQTIVVDVATDTLQSLVARINSAGAGVTASYDEATDQLIFTPDTPGATLVLEGDTSGFLAAVAVSEGASGTVVNPSARFDGTGLNAPLLDPGQAISAGSFTVNGVVITVSASDTLNAVLARITASQAGVTATFDAASETVRLTAKTAGSSSITLADDTSGFLAAVKLDASALSTTGIRSVDTPLANQAIWASVTSGTLTFNGNSITVDPAVDSLADIVAAIDALNGVSASLDSSTGVVKITSERFGAALEIADDTGLLTTLGIATGLIRGRAAVRGTVDVKGVRDREQAAASAAANVVASVNEALERLGRSPGTSSKVRDAFLRAMRDAMAAPGAPSGFSMSRADGADRLVIDVEAMANALAKDPHALDAFLSAARALPMDLDGAAASVTPVAPAIAAVPQGVASRIARPATSIVAEFRQRQLIGSLQTATRRVDLLA